ncbi:unnamed protein product [Rotaria sordida]|uniref:Uncharacterized protein n=4 Tax=Rotaria sordida TaxID=392033 RepID=A0A819EXP2_9BILA|nr:unnamed protein product [Rotaria sordida]CAF3858121.1 unnamed protein product [Rotaria sordida]
MLNKYDVLTMLKKNFNENVKRNAADTDLMFNYRHALHGKVHPVLKNKPDALLFQLYIDEISLTNPIGAKKDTQKITMVYFQLEDLPDIVKSMLNSIGLVAMCHSNYLSNKLNRKKFFDPIVEDLNVLQTTGVFIPTLGDYLNFAFTVLVGDHLASNDIGGFQKNFNTGEFCRHCHVNYDQKLVPLNQISHPCRMRDQHDNIVQQIINSNNNIVLRGVVDASPLANLIGFHAVISLPNDLMHDFNEGVCGQLLMAMLKEASTKRILTYGEIESRLLSFEYGNNDKSNKPPVTRKKHLNKGKIVGTASQRMLLFKLFPIIFYDIIDRLETKEIYICLREIVSLVFACPFRKSWLSYLQSLSVRFQCLMVHLLPQLVIPKVHFVTDYAKQIEMNGPAIRHWCMRFESKHRVFKQLAVKSNNFKNILYTLSKRNQMHQCLLLSFSNYYTIVNEGYSLLEREFYTLPIHVRKLLEKYVEYIDHTTKIMEYQRLKFNHCICLGEDIDGETLFNLPQSMVYEIIKPLKERVRFLTEHHALFHGTFRNNSDQTTSDKCDDNLLDSSSQSLIEECNFAHVTTQSTGALAKNYQGDATVFDSSCNPDNVNEETSMSSKEDDNKENNDDDEESVFPNIYVVPDLPPKLQQIIQKGELNEFRSHTNVRRLLLDTIFNHVTNEYSLLYPNKDQYKSMGKAILKTLNIPKDKEILNEWIESLKNKFKRERRPLQQTSAEVQQMKVKYGNSIGRPIKRTNNLIAPRRVSSVEFWNKIDLHDDPEDLHKNVQFMKNELVDQNFDWDQVKNPWKKTLVQRRTFIRDHTTKEVLQEYPGYRYALLIFDEVRYVCNVDIELNLKSMLPKLLDCIPDNSGFVNDLPAVRLIKLLSKYFSDSWQHILSSKEPLSPRPSIQITTDKFIIFLDYEIITETPSIDQALCVVISLYVLFELQFGSHNRIIQLLYGILLQEPGALTKPLRLLLNQWNFIVDKKEYKRNIQMPTTISTTTKTLTTTVENLIQAEDSQADNLYDSEEEQEYIENTTGLPSFFEEQNKSSIFALLGYIQSLTTTTPTSDEDLMKDYPLESSDSSNSSSPIDRPLLIHTLPTEKQQVITSPLPLLNDNPIRNVNIKHQTSSKSIDQSSTIQKKIIFAARKRSSSPDEPIASRLKRSRLKTKN